MSALSTLHRRLATAGPANLAERLLFLPLWTVSAIYRAIVCARLAAYRGRLFSAYRAGVPVVSVGNLAAGGTGKTPVVDLLLRWAESNAVRAAVVSRGYGGRPGSDPLLVSNGRRLLVDNPSLCGDEPLLLARRNPGAMIIVAPRRAAGVRLAEEAGARLVILDDGFQHLAVQRDLDIVLLDSQRPFGNHRLLPAGMLREPVRHLSRADLVIMTRCEDGGLTLPVFDGPLLRARHLLSDNAVGLDGRNVQLADLAGRPCVVFAGIAEPAGFFAALRKHGITPVTELAMADHQVYSPAVLARLSSAVGKAEFYVTTEKDAVKLTSVALPLPCYRVPLEITIEPFPLLDQKLRQLLAKE
jgi:tetraacyldisaccharide 4'-kinase